MPQTIHSMPQTNAARRRTALKANLTSLTVGLDLETSGANSAGWIPTARSSTRDV